jgi:hypothetical protein
MTSRHNTTVILRRPRSGRLEGWKHAPSLLPSFETRAFGALLRMTVQNVLRNDETDRV